MEMECRNAYRTIWRVVISISDDGYEKRKFADIRESGDFQYFTQAELVEFGKTPTEASIAFKLVFHHRFESDYGVSGLDIPAIFTF
jgi:hypothetical protein